MSSSQVRQSVCLKNMNWLLRITVEPALLLVMISMGLTGGVSMQYVRHVIYSHYNLTGGSNMSTGPCSRMHNDTPSAEEEAAKSELNGFSVISGFVGGLPALFVTLIVSAASDKIGRKLPLLLPVVGMLFGTCVFLVVAIFELSLIILLVSNIVVSFSGNYALFFSGCSSYVADTTSKTDRTFVFAVLFTVSLIGSSVAGIGAGYWVQDGIYTDPFWLALAILLVVLVYLIVWIRETVPSAKSQSSGGPNDKLSPSSTCKTLSGILKGFLGILKVAEKGRRIWLVLALLVLFLSLGVFGAINSILFVRLLAEPFCWNSVLLGFFNASKPFINGLVNVVGCFHALPPAILTARMSKIIEPNLQGALFSLTGTTESLATLLGPFLLGLIYQGTLNTFPLAVFIVMIGLTLVTMVIVGVLMVI